jgi:hypothetical protein
MNVKMLALLIVILTVLSIGLAQKLPAGMKPLPKPVPSTCPSDLLCW